MSQCKVYILHSEHLSRYCVGSTSQSIPQRLAYHLGNHKSYTSRGKDWREVYVSHFENKTEALRIENKIKKRGTGRYLLDNLKEQSITPMA